eukprot:5749613-Prymnesium_polylepis.1
MGPLWATRREAGSDRRARLADPASGPPRGVRGGPTRDGTGPSGPGLASWVLGPPQGRCGRVGRL